MKNEIMKNIEMDLGELISAMTETSDPIMYQYYKGLEENKLLITGQIDSSAIEMYVLPLKEWDEDEKVENIHIYVNCVGGSIFEGMMVAETINKLKTPTTVEILGYAYSMGGYIGCAGISNENVKVVCHEYTTFLIHAGSTQLSGDSGAVEDMVDFYKVYNEKMDNFLVENSKLTKEKLKEMRRVEWYMTSDKMLEYGLIDEII